MGDQKFMTDFYERNRRLLWFLAGKYTQTPQDREDLVHDSLLRLIRNVRTLRRLEEAAAAAYLAKTVHTVAMDRAKAACAREIPVEDARLEELSPTVPEEEAKWDMAYLEQKLPGRDWFLLQAKYIRGLSDGEIGRALGVSPGSVRMALTRARAKAREVLQEVER